MNILKRRRLHKLHDEPFDETGESFIRGVTLAVSLTVSLVWIPLAAYLLG